MATWPTGKRFTPVIGSLVEGPPSNSIRSSMDKGPDKVRRRTTANVRSLSFKLILSKADTAVFDTFFVTTTASGSIEFDYTHPRTGAACTARFAQEPSYAERSGVVYEISVALEILP